MSPNLSVNDRQRALLSRVREANRARTATEMNAADLRKARQQEADAALAAVSQKIEQTRDQTLSQADAARRQSLSDADANQDNTFDRIDALGSACRDAASSAQHLLTPAGLPDQLSHAAVVTPNVATSALAALESSSSQAVARSKEIQTLIIALFAERDSMAARRKTLRIVLAIAISLAAMILLSISISWYNSWQRAREARVAQATATAQAIVNATATAMAGPTATAEAVALVAGAMATATAVESTIHDVWVNPVDEAVYFFVPGTDYLDDFWIMRTEVTNGQYSRCVSAGACSEPDNNRWQDAAYAGHPVTDVFQSQAWEYARWAGGALPTDEQWERACRGDNGREYPWGDDAPNSELANYGGQLGDTQIAGSYPAGASPYGALDMGGNVWEWGDAPGVVRGGAFYVDAFSVRCVARNWHSGSARDTSIGFRVVSPSP